MIKKSGSAFEKMVMQKSKTNNKGSYIDEKKSSNNRFLVNINILGSAGPIRFVVNEKELVSGVIDTALKSYAREGRIPVLGFDASNFLLYCANAGFDGMVANPFGKFVELFFVIGAEEIRVSISEELSYLSEELALNPLKPIGCYGARNFVLCKKQVCSSKTEPQSEHISQKSSGGWKAWLNKSKSFGLKVLSH